MKTCTKCGVEKELGEFSKDRNRKDGLCSVCKACAAAKNKAYRVANKEKIAARDKAHYEANLEKELARAEVYYKTNKEKITARASAYKLRKRYDITPADKDDMIDIQGRCCILCNKPLEVDNCRKVNIDHCHDTGEVRGIMCSACNRMEGMVRTAAKKLDMTFSQVCDRMKEYSTQYVQGVEDVL